MDELSEFFFALHDAVITAADITDLPKQYHFLEFVMNSFPEGVEEYLAQEPQHFAALANRSDGTATAVYVHSMAFKILCHSQLWKTLEGPE